MSPAIVVVLLLVGVAVLVMVIVRFAPSAIELLDLDPRTRAGARLAAEEEDMRQLLEVTGRQRRPGDADDTAAAHRDPGTPHREPGTP
jgi:hypothetical protein